MVFDDQIARLNDVFDNRCRPVDGSPEAREDDPLGAWLEVQVPPGLKLRLVRDRGRDHVDVKCKDGGAERWVPLEIVAVALDGNLLGDYVDAFNATLHWDGDDQLPEDATFLPDAIDFVAQYAGALAAQAANADSIRNAERRIATETQPILECLGISQIS